MNIDWKRKLTSRKFWMAVASFVSLMVVAFGGSQDIAAQIVALIMAGATVIGYIFAEGLTDQAGLIAETDTDQPSSIKLSEKYGLVEECTLQEEAKQ